MTNSTANDNYMSDHPQAFELQVFWIPQVPMEPFIYRVPTLEAAKILCDALAQYDLFQYENKVKPDYTNAGGASWRHPELTGGEWYDFDPMDDADYREVETAIAKVARTASL
jgi:Superinfection exclusion gene product 17